jgi:chemotaxis protein CheD
MTLLTAQTTPPTETVIAVGIGQFAISRDPATVLSAYGLGSCVAIAAWDSQAHVAGMMHVLLPEPPSTSKVENPARFATTGVPLLLRELEAAGAMRTRLRLAAAGGAQMLGALTKVGALGGIGARNSDLVTQTLRAAGLSLSATDFGGTAGRTLTLVVATGHMTVRLAGGNPRDLA